MNRREATFEAIAARGSFPVVILGGGINGIGLFRELALHGVDCLLLDKADFAAGATSKSSRMIHGGLRYLENGEFGLVRESLRERNRLLVNAAHYVAPLRTTIPIFGWMDGIVRSPLVFLGLPVKPGGRGALIVKCGLTFYDLVTRAQRRTPRHFFNLKGAALRTLPRLNPGIVAAATYWDAYITQAERLCIELIRDARALNPGSHALNYATVEEVRGGALVVRDGIGGATCAVEPRVVVNAAGAWVDAANARLGLATHLIGGTKGSHLVVDSRELHAAIGDRMVYYEHRDGRVCITFTFMGKVIMGSTDIRVEDPETAACDAEEERYICESLAGVFPGIRVAPEQIVHRFCGVRPLPASAEETTGRISRGHMIEFAEPDTGRPFPVASLIGGKWTTFRAFAEQTADRVLPLIGAARKGTTEDMPIGGGRGYPAGAEEKARWIERAAAAHGLSPARVEVLLSRYGTRAEEYCALPEARAERPLASLPAYTDAEIRWIAAGEQVEHLSDLVCRRSVIALLGDARRDALAELAAAAGEALGWPPPRREEEAARALRESGA
ncbi:MAG TPA: glycerol-3-phosphate dehydrogenase [Planctomycetes bacterium]|nr:glycerol-3-phosphate dehydrogenase [Planctomycetota bacterium]